MSPVIFAKLMYGNKTYIIVSEGYWWKVKRSCQKVKRLELRVCFGVKSLIMVIKNLLGR